MVANGWFFGLTTVDRRSALFVVFFTCCTFTLLIFVVGCCFTSLQPLVTRPADWRGKNSTAFLSNVQVSN